MDKNSREAPWFAAVLESMTDAVLVTDRKGVVVHLNRAAETLLGLSSKQVLAHPVQEIMKLTDPQTTSRFKLPSMRTFFKSATPHTFSKLQLQTGHNHEVTVDLVLSPLTTSGSRIEGSVLVFRDITNALEKEEANRNTERIEAIASISGIVALEFSNWLSIISGHAASVSENLIPNTRAHDNAMRILDATQHAGTLAKRLTSIARATETDTDTDTEMEDIDLTEAVRDASTVLANTFADQQITIKARNMDSSPFVRGNARQLLDCLLNLFLNAVDAMPNGGTITIDVSDKTDNGQPFSVLRIRDTGSGMSKEVADRMFEPFFSTKQPGSAIGLGLTVVQSSVQSWGGYVRVRSRLGHGTSFRLFIPSAKGVGKEKKRTASGGETILLADDRQELLDEASAILREEGYQVHTAAGGKDCVSLYKKHAESIHLSIIDLVMPDMDGKEVLTEIMAVNPSAAIIMTSGFSREYVRNCLERGTWGFTQKPFDRAQLLSAVRRVLDQRSDRTKTGLS